MSCPVEKLELRRDVTVWGSYMWGYADVGADIYAALGLVMGAAHGGASLAFFVAGLIYIMIGLSYTEMASTYPVAGGGHYYALRGLGDFWGYAAGVALLLDYTIDIALFVKPPLPRAVSTWPWLPRAVTSSGAASNPARVNASGKPSAPSAASSRKSRARRRPSARISRGWRRRFARNF